MSDKESEQFVLAVLDLAELAVQRRTEQAPRVADADPLADPERPDAARSDPARPGPARPARDDVPLGLGNRNALDEGTEQEVYDLLDRGDDIEGFLDLLMHLRLAWDPDWPEKNPIQIAGNQIVRFEDPKVMVEFR